MATMFPPAVKACAESLSPLPPTPMQATLIRSFAPRTRPTYGKGRDAAPAAKVARRRKVLRSRTFLLVFLFSITIYCAQDLREDGNGSRFSSQSRRRV